MGLLPPLQKISTHICQSHKKTSWISSEDNNQWLNGYVTIIFCIFYNNFAQTLRKRFANSKPTSNVHIRSTTWSTGWNKPLPSNWAYSTFTWRSLRSPFILFMRLFLLNASQAACLLSLLTHNVDRYLIYQKLYLFWEFTRVKIGVSNIKVTVGCDGRRLILKTFNLLWWRPPQCVPWRSW